MKTKAFIRVIRLRDRLYIVRASVCLDRCRVSKTGLWPLGGKKYRYQEHNRTITGVFFHAGPLADARLVVENN